MIGLTRKQRELYDFIAARVVEKGVAPSISEMTAALRLSATSKSHVREMLLALEERGYIRRLPHKARAIEIIQQDGAGDLVTLHPEVRSAALDYARRTHTTLSAVIREAVREYVGKAA